MWLVTTCGYYSIVAKPSDQRNGMLTIRSRVRADLEAFEEFVLDLGRIANSEQTDYSYRAKAKAKDIALGFRSMVENIDYGNFRTKLQ